MTNHFERDEPLKVAVKGSRSICKVDLGKYLPEGVTEIVSGGARGIDTCAKEYALANHLGFTEFLPQYERYRRNAPLKRNLSIIDYSDLVIAFWDGISKGTKYVIDNCKMQEKKVIVHCIARKEV